MAGQPWSTLRYPLATYPFPHLIAEVLCGGPPDDLSRLDAAHSERWTRATDQSSGWHRRFYDSVPRWAAVYQAFIADVVAPVMGEPVYYQAVPTFRVHLPGNVAVGEFHTDGQYHHPAGELTFWLPLTPAWDTNSVWIESDSSELWPVRLRPGEIAVFDAVGRRHGNRINTTGSSRVSFDFRCLPARLCRDTDQRSVNAGLRFVPGEYYHSDVVGGPT